MSLLVVDDLTIRYGRQTVVDKLGFSLERGESLGVVGESGSGKSQTALSLLGLLPGDAAVSGSIRFDGQELRNATESTLDRVRARRIGMVFQDPMQALNPYLRIGRQLRQILLSHRIADGRDADSRVVDMLRKVRLPDAERQVRAYPHQLSGGMRQRVMLASALIAGPELLIADEPTTALDVTVQAQILDLLEELRDDTALLLITHDLGVVAGRCERLLVLEQGKRVESGATTAVFAAPSHAHTRALLAAAPRVDRGDGPATTPGPEVLAIDDVNVSYRITRRVELEAVVGADLLLHQAETLAVVGESGSGKTSLLRAILGLIPLRAGRVVYAGQPLGGPEQRSLAQRRDLQLVFQDPMSALNPQMRVRSIVGEPLVVHEPSLNRSERRARVVATLDKVGLDEKFLRRYPHELSGGQAQRVAIARALILNPKVLLCDEAVAALDSSVRQRVLDLLKAIQEQSGLSIVFISHDLAVVRSISHRIAVMYMGRLVEEADNASLFGAPRHPYTSALIDAVPVPDPLAPRAPSALGGEIPSLENPPAGCVFHPRCAFAVDACRETEPKLREIQGSRVACHRADDPDLGGVERP